MTHPPAVVTAASATSSAAATAAAICAILFPSGVATGVHCRILRMKVSTADNGWVSAVAGLYNAQNQPASDEDQVLVNLRTRQLIGPTSVGFCGAGPDQQQPIGGYASVPASVLAGLGLKPCGQAGSSGPVATTPAGAGSSVGALAGSWGAHETSLTIDGGGHGLIRYADLTKCPTCSAAGAPLGTLDFVLTKVSNGVASGRVTASSDTKNWAVGAPVVLAVTPAAPGRFLELTIAGKALIPFCDAAAAGQCGA